MLFIKNKLRRGVLATMSGFTLARLKLLLRYFYLNKIKKELIPQIMTVGVTYRCQCKCIHCSSGVPNRKKSKNNGEMKTSEIKDLIDQAILIGIPRITFFGGEPLMRNDLFELIHYANTSGMITRINTNGLALNEKVVKKLKNAGLTYCDVSIDDPNPEIHDKLRGVSGLFNKAIKGIELLRKNRMLCQIVTYAARRNVTEGLDRIIKLGRNLDVTEVQIVFPMATGCWYESYEELLNAEQRQQVQKLADSSFVHVEIPTAEDKCNVVKKSSLYISPDGDVTPCPFIPWSFGNIRQQRLDTMVNIFYSKFSHDYRGDCIMNDQYEREYLRKTIDEVKIPVFQIQPK